MVKIAVLTSNSIRHKYFTNIINNHFQLVGFISEPKADYYTSQINDSELVSNHFKNLKKNEIKYVGKYKFFPECKHKKIPKKGINNPKNINWIETINPDYILLFGTGILSDEWCKKFKDRIINLHLGLSPYYRGSATLFWPFVNDELEYVGATIHLVIREVDAGPILATVWPRIEVGDSYYDINYKTIKTAIDIIPSIINKYHQRLLKPRDQDISKHKYYYRKADFNEDVLLKVLMIYTNGITLSELNEINSKVEIINH